MVTTANAELIHRYSFNTDANDSVGTAHATLIQGASLNGLGQVALNNPGYPASGGTAAQYVRLGAGSDVLPASGSVTLEQWFNFGPSGYYSEAYTFSDSTPPDGAQGQYFMHTVSFPADLAVSGGSRVVQTNAGWGAETSVFASPGRPDAGFLDNGQPHMAATVWDTTAGTLSYYIDGILQNTVPTPHTLASFAFTNAWLGRSAFAGDAASNGTIDEFRVYDSALSASDIATHYALGPNLLVPEPTSLAMLGVVGALLRRRR